jgi:hypothetical protein
MLATELEIEAPSDVQLPVFTLEPHAILDDDVHAFEMAADDLKLFILAHTSPSSILELLLHPDRLPAVPIATWVKRNQSITDVLAESALSTSEKRRAAFAYGWNDNSYPVHLGLARLGLDLNAISHITAREIPRLVSSQPMQSYFSELFVQRHISRSTRWKDNDLTDMMFLSCAAGYASYVAAENQTGTQLQQAQRARGLDATVHLSVEPLVAAIRADGVESLSERSEVRTAVRTT